MGRSKLIQELMIERQKYNRLLEMERTAAPEYVDVIAYLIKASEKRLELLRKELDAEMEMVG